MKYKDEHGVWRVPCQPKALQLSPHFCKEDTPEMKALILELLQQVDSPRRPATDGFEAT